MAPAVTELALSTEGLPQRARPRAPAWLHLARAYDVLPPRQRYAIAPTGRCRSMPDAKSRPLPHQQLSAPSLEHSAPARNLLRRCGVAPGGISLRCETIKEHCASGPLLFYSGNRASGTHTLSRCQRCHLGTDHRASTISPLLLDVLIARSTGATGFIVDADRCARACGQSRRLLPGRSRLRRVPAIVEPGQRTSV